MNSHKPRPKRRGWEAQKAQELGYESALPAVRGGTVSARRPAGMGEGEIARVIFQIIESTTGWHVVKGKWMDPNTYMQQFQMMQRQSDKAMMWILGIGLVIILINFVIMVIFMAKVNQLMESCSKYLDTKAVLMMAELEGKRFVDERVGLAKPSAGDDANYRPKV